MLKLYNTLTRKKEIFKPFKNKEVGLYACGPTVYFFAHIGNLRTYIFEDILKRALEYNGYKVKHVMNITDVGHLTSDADSGEDKMIKALRREGKELNKESMFEIADFYTKAFKKDLRFLNIEEPDIWCKATENIKEQIDLIKKIIKNGYAYETESAVYFNTFKLKEYKKLAKLDLKNLKKGARIKERSEKKNSTDFALWIKLKGEHKNHIMNWSSPWGEGFPGWHVECSAMSIKYLGNKIDIHCGGTDHIPVHHTNERAQNIAAIKKPVVKSWMHGAFLVLKTGKMSKSRGKNITLQNLIEKGFDPLAYRYLCLNAHYRSMLTFSFDALKGAEQALNNLREKVREFKKSEDVLESSRFKNYLKKFNSFIGNDLDIPKALALTWKMVKDNKLSEREKYELLLSFDNIFGLDLQNVKEIKIPQEIKELVKKREQFRRANNWKRADQIRKKIEKLGFQIEDVGINVSPLISGGKLVSPRVIIKPRKELD